MEKETEVAEATKASVCIIPGIAHLSTCLAHLSHYAGSLGTPTLRAGRCGPADARESPMTYDEWLATGEPFGADVENDSDG